jgi:hypothetical protein
VRADWKSAARRHFAALGEMRQSSKRGDLRNVVRRAPEICGSVTQTSPRRAHQQPNPSRLRPAPPFGRTRRGSDRAADCVVSSRSSAKTRFICCSLPSCARSAMKTNAAAGVLQASPASAAHSKPTDRARASSCVCRVRAQISAMLPAKRSSGAAPRSWPAACSSLLLEILEQRRARERRRGSAASSAAPTSCFKRFLDGRAAAFAGRSASRESRSPRCASLRRPSRSCRGPDIITTGIVNSPACRPLLEQRDTVGIGHPDVEQDQVGSLSRRGSLRAAAAFSATPDTSGLRRRESRKAIHEFPFRHRRSVLAPWSGPGGGFA